MSIGVQSYPELYTMLIGWNLYDQLWSLLTKTGLAFLPFIGIVLRNIARPYQSQEAKDAAGTSLRRMEIDFIATLLIIFLGVSPFLPLNATVISYTPNCPINGEKNTYHPGGTGTTWDKAFVIPNNDIRVPLWWYAVMSISEGFASSANTMVGCPADLRKMVTQVDMTQLTDPELKKELRDFNTNCYIPAKAQYYNDVKNNAATVQTIDNDRNQFGADDTEWFGSHAFQDTYYKTSDAKETIPGFNYNPNDDINADTNKNNPPAYGIPSCYDWWNDSTNGLKARLNAALPQSFWDEFKSYISNDQSKDNIIKRLADNNTATGYQNANNMIGGGGFSHVFSSLGIWFDQLSTYPKIYAAAEAAPIIQALLLLMIYTFLPFALVFTGYKASSFISGAVIIFSIIFWSFIWHLVSYVDTTLMNALYTSNNWFDHQSPSATLADMITGTLIIVAPLFWFVFMGSMGLAIGNVVSSAFSSMDNVGGSAAAKGGGVVKAAAEVAGTAMM